MKVHRDFLQIKSQSDWHILWEPFFLLVEKVVWIMSFMILTNLNIGSLNSFCQLKPCPVKSLFQLKADRPPPRDYSTHRQTSRTDNDSSLLFAALGKAEPLISTAARRKFDLELWPWPVTLTQTFDLDPDLWPWPWPWSYATLMSKHDFWHLTWTFDLRPWPTIPT